MIVLKKLLLRLITYIGVGLIMMLIFDVKLTTSIIIGYSMGVLILLLIEYLFIQNKS